MNISESSNYSEEPQMQEVKTYSTVTMHTTSKTHIHKWKKSANCVDVCSESNYEYVIFMNNNYVGGT